MFSRRSLEGGPTITMEDLKNDTMYSNVVINARTSLGYAPLYQAVSMISGDVAKLPLNVYRKTETGRSVASDHPVHSLIKRNTMTNIELNSYKFMRRYMVSALLFGNAYAYIDRSATGRVLGLYHLLPDRTYMERTNQRLWCITETGGRLIKIPAQDVLHIEGISIDGIQAESILKRFRDDFEKALNAKAFSSKFFKNGMSAGGFLVAPDRLRDKPESIRKVQSAVDKHFSGPDNAFKTIVLREGFKWFSTQVNPADAQLTETHEEDARNIARIYNISPSRLGLKNSTSYNSEEMARRDYYDGALSHWCMSISSEFSTKLLTQEERDAGHYIEHQVNALLWADAKTRSEIAIAGIMNGRFSPDETRAWENMDSYTGGDTFYIPLNMRRVGDPEPQPQMSEATRDLLKQVFERAINRISIKADRTKSNPIQSDFEALKEMLDATLDPLGRMFDRNLAQYSTAWLGGLLSFDAESLRANAEQTAAKLIDSIMENGR